MSSLKGRRLHSYNKIIAKYASPPKLQEDNDFFACLTVHDYDLMKRSDVCSHIVFA